MTKADNLAKIYVECSNGYHKVDDFRAKLLGFLPLASGAGIFGALYLQPNDTHTLSGNFVALGIFGVLITLGLLIFELKGIVKCTQFIYLGSWIERQMREASKDYISEKDFDKFLPGYFTRLGYGKVIMDKIVTEPVASAIIYSTVLAAWSYVIFIKSGDLRIAAPIIIFFVSAASMYLYCTVPGKKLRTVLKTMQIPLLKRKHE